MLPFEPETEAQLMARFPAALTPDYDVREIVKHPESRPGLLRKHVFDFGDGIRMIASVDFDDQDRALHLSFSVQPSFFGIFSRRTFRQRVVSLIEKFAKPDPHTLASHQISPKKGVDHFLFKLPPKT
jgi:hypothetical protein